MSESCAGGLVCLTAGRGLTEAELAEKKARQKVVDEKARRVMAEVQAVLANHYASITADDLRVYIHRLGSSAMMWDGSAMEWVEKNEYHRRLEASLRAARAEEREQRERDELQRLLQKYGS